MGKWGGVLFVKGGVLVQTEDFKKIADPETSTEIGASNVEDTMAADEKATKRREKAEKRRRKEEKRKAREAQNTQLDPSCATAGSREDNPSHRENDEAKSSLAETRKQQKADKKRALAYKNATDPLHTKPETSLSLIDDLPIIAHSKSEKRKRRAEKRMRESSESPAVDDGPVDEDNGKQSLPAQSRLTSKQSKRPESKTAISKLSDTGASSAPVGRHIIRGRHIAQKKAAFLNDSSLKGIFTAKAR